MRRPRSLVLFAVLVAAALVRVSITRPRVHVRWDPALSQAERVQQEARFSLLKGTPVDEAPVTWRYRLGDSSPANIRALLQHPAVRDTAYIRRDTLATEEGSAYQLRIANPFAPLFATPRRAVQLLRSLCGIAAGMTLIWAAGTPGIRRRAAVAVGALLLVGAVAIAFPFDPSLITMGGSADHVASRSEFESWWTGRVRFEKHLSQVILWQTYLRYGPTASAPELALVALTRVAAIWFVVTAAIIGAAERWSPPVLRYLGLVVMAPAALLYFGWRELGYVSLSAASFPLLARGLRDRSMRLEAGGALGGLGAALHGSGLVSLAGTFLSAVGASGTFQERGGRTLRVVAWGTAAYLGWTALYVILLKFSIQPDPGAAEFSPWRPWLAGEVRSGRLAAAVVSPTGLRDVLVSAWIVGLPLGIVAASLRRRLPDEVKAALWYTPPSLAFLVFRWPFDGIGQGLDLVFAGFPALYAFAWVCAQERRHTTLAAVLLASAHYAFWWTIFDERFQT